MTITIHMKNTATPLVIQQVADIDEGAEWLEVRTSTNKVYKITTSEIQYTVEEP